MTVASRIVLALGLLASAPGASFADREPLSKGCEVPQWVKETAVNLPHAAASVQKTGRLKIVALGSSSTLGSGGSGSEQAWPSRLEAELKRRLPQTNVTVLNKGQLRQSVPQMLARMKSDALAEQPSLVIWEAGTSEAVRGVDVDTFTSGLLSGIDVLSGAQMDVILMDMQYARNTARLINFQPYVEAISRVGNMRDVYVFPRHEIMREWVENDQISFDVQPGPESVKVADQVYGCIARYLAALIARNVAAR